MAAHESTIRAAEDWLQSVFYALGTNYTERFSGLGLILYYPPLALPVLPLVHRVLDVQLPTRNLQESIRLLHTLCQFDSVFHDGFHLVDSETLSITHVSHFFSPPIPDNVPSLVPDHPIGARFMSAWLGSLLSAACMTATLNRAEGGLMFMQGTVRTLFPPAN